MALPVAALDPLQASSRSCCSLLPSPCARLSQAAYMALSVVALDYLHDAWFYWGHRLLHWRPLYKHVHAIHHE